MKLFGIGVVLALVAPSPAHAVETSVTISQEQMAPTNVEGLSWKVEEGFKQRYYLESEVHLPMYMWFLAEYNQQARVSAFQIRTVVDCVGEPTGRRGRIDCTLEDVGLHASALPGDAGLLDPILAELDEKLTGAHVTFALKPNGRIADVALVDVNHRNRRISRMRENLRLVVLRAVSGLDLQLPPRGEVQGTTWAQYHSSLVALPSVTGTTATADMAHQVVSVDEGVVRIATGGRTVMSAGTEMQAGPGFNAEDTSTNFYSGTVSGEARFDTRSGRLIERQWSVVTRPTASSVSAEGFQGIPYGQWGYLVALEPGVTRPVGETGEMAPPGAAPSALQQWTILGAGYH